MSKHSLTLRALKYWIVALFFLAWDQKRKIRNVLRKGSLAVLVLSTILLLAEVFAEYFGAEHIVAALKFFGQTYGLYVFLPVAVGALILAHHHVEEARRPEYEYAFILRLWEFMESYRKSQNSGTGRPIRDVLEIFHRLYKNAGVAHVSIFRKGEDEILRIKPEEVYPPEDDRDFYVELRTGEGVAGKVFEDMKARYMPLLFLGRLFFPHAINFEWETETVPGQPRPTFDLKDLDFQLDIFKPSSSRKFPFRSFLSVPLKSSVTGRCNGVLNFDFYRLDPLDKRDVAMAMVIGLILADEL